MPFAASSSTSRTRLSDEYPYERNHEDSQCSRSITCLFLFSPCTCGDATEISIETTVPPPGVDATL